MANTIKLKTGSGSDPSASDLIVGEIAIRTDSGKLFTKKDNGSVAEISGSGTGLEDGDKGDITVSNGGDTFTIDNGVVTSAKIADGTIVNADISGSAAIAGSKLQAAGLVNAGSMSAANFNKLAGIEANATADMTGSEILSTISGENIILGEISSTGNSSFAGNVTISSSDGGSAAAPELDLYRISASPADADYLGQIKFSGESDDDSKEVYAKITGKIGDASSGTEDGIIEIAHRKAGSNNISARFTSTDLKLINGTGLEVAGNISCDGTVDGVDIAARDTLFGGLTSSSGVLTNGVTATTQGASDSTTKVATTAYVTTAINNLINGAPSALDTLNELAAAMNDDAAFSTTVTNSLATKMPLAGGQFTGNITFSGSQTVDGRDLSVDGAKLDGIESGATADQTASEILTLIKTVDGSGSGLDADTLDGLGSGSFTRSNANDTVSGNLNFTSTTTPITTNSVKFNNSEMSSSYYTDATGVLAFDENFSSDTAYGTGATSPASTFGSDGGGLLIKNEDGWGAVLSSTNIPHCSGNFANLKINNNQVFHAGNLSVGDGGLTQNNFTDADHSKLNGIETGATADQTASEILTLIKTVDGSGSGLDADTLDGIGSGSFVRSDADDTLNGQYIISDSADEKLQLAGSSNPYIRWQEGTTDKAYIQWLSSGIFQFVNQESGEYLRIASGANGLTYTHDGNGSTVWHAGNDGSGSGLDADTVDGIEASSFVRSDANDTSSGTIAFGTGALDPDSFSSHSGGFGNIQDGSGWAARGVFVHGGGTGDAAAMAHNGSKLYFGIQNNASANSMETWLDVTPASRIINFQTDDNTNNVRIGGNKIFHAGNDGSGSGLDSDLLDGQEGSYYLNYNNFSNTPTIPTNNNQLTNGAGFLTSVGTSNIANDAVTNAKIADDAVDTAQINNNAVTNSKLTSNAVTTAKISDDAVTFAKVQNIAQNHILGRIASGTGDTQQLSASELRTIINVANGATNVTNNNQLTNGAGYITGSSLNASNLSSGTIPDARFPSTLPAVDGSNLTGISAGATGGGNDQCFYENDQTVTTNYTITNGKNAMAAGPLTINSGVTVTVGSGETLTIV